MRFRPNLEEMGVRANPVGGTIVDATETPEGTETPAAVAPPPAAPVPYMPFQLPAVPPTEGELEIVW